MEQALAGTLVVAVVLASLWATLALLFAGPLRNAWANGAFAALYAVGTLAALIGLRPFWLALGACLVGIVTIAWWFFSLEPSNDRDWQPDVARLAWAELSGDTLTFHNVRNFAYRSTTEFTPRYEDRVYDLAKLRGFDLFLSYWGSPVIAHTFVSWDFADAPPLTISVETRKHKGQEYSALKGFFRQYEIIYVAADERDLAGVRVNFRGEDVYLYRTTASPELARGLLLDYVESMNALREKPAFYNALVDNCTTTIRHHVEHLDPEASPFDWRIFANGYGDQFLYERGSIDCSLPFAELRARSRINAKAKSAADDEAFSIRIREGLPDPRATAVAGAPVS